MPVRSGQSPSPPAPLWKTGQYVCYDNSAIVIPCVGTGQDGDIRAGVAWPNPRFTFSVNCVTDNLTGLMWARNANLPNGSRNWQGALDYVAVINSGSGLCGHHDWRLPNRKEFRSLIDHSQYNPPLQLNHPFNNVRSFGYWSSTSDADDPIKAWVVTIWDGSANFLNKGDNSWYVWPVRPGQGGLWEYSIYLSLIMR